MLKEFFGGFMLGFRRKVWVIERRLGDTSESWDTLGSIVGVNDPESAIAAARSSWSDLYADASEHLRAVAWSTATREQIKAAIYEDNLRESEQRIRDHERDRLRR
jgi:hypothetical protein